MMEFKFSGDNEKLLIECITSMIKDNPIILHNILDPYIQKILDGLDMTYKIETEIVNTVDTYVSNDSIENTIATAVKSIIKDGK